MNFSCFLRNRWCFLLLFFLISVAFFPSLKNDFTHWDDNSYITDNALVKDLSWASVWTLFTSFQVFFYSPLTLLSYSLEFSLFGANPVVFHLTNILLHLANSFLAYLFLFSLRRDPFLALGGAILFAIHPLRVESVAWISGRKDVLAGFFFFLSLRSYLRYVDEKQANAYYESIFFSLLCFLAKPICLLQPILLLLIDFSRTRPVSRQTILEKTPFFLLSLVFGILTIQAQQQFGAIQEALTIPFWQRLFLSGYILAFYLGKLLWPVNLAIAYPYPLLPPDSFPLWLATGAALAGIFLFILFWAIRRDFKDLFFGGSFFLLLIIPNLQLIPVGGGMAFDRYTYLPGLGFFFLATLLLQELWRRISLFPVGKWAAITGYLLLIITLVTLTQARCEVWKNSMSLWNDQLKQYPKFNSFLLNRGMDYLTDGDPAKALEDFEAGLKYTDSTRHSPIHFKMGLAYNRLEQSEEAIKHFSLALVPPAEKVSRVLASRAYVFKKQGLFIKALEDLAQASQLDEKEFTLPLLKAQVHEALQQNDLALQEYSRAIELNPESMEAWKNRGVLLTSQGKWNLAFSDFQEALKLAPFHAPNWFNRGQLLVQFGKIPEGISDLSRALEVDPEMTPARALRARCLAQSGKFQEALVDARQCLEKEPDSPALAALIASLSYDAALASASREGPSR